MPAHRIVAWPSPQVLTDEWVFSVRDNGMGIPEADRQRIFRPFTRLAGAAHSAGGAGLGLATC